MTSLDGPILYVSEKGGSGYARAARDYVIALHRSGTPVTWVPVGWRRGRAEPLRGATDDAELEALRGPHAPYGRIVLHVMPHLYGSWMSSGVPAVGYTAWETDRLPESWTLRLNRLGRVLVPCRWKTLLASGVTPPVDVVPHILPGDVARLDPLPPAGPFTFYCIAPWTVRKGVDLLVRAFWQAFPDGEPVRLVLKTSERDLTRHSRAFALWRLARLWHTSRRALARLRSRQDRPAPVELIAGDLSREEILDVHRAGHCFVSLTRGEGWGLGAFEAAGIGNPVVITGLGGHLDFLDPDLAYLVDYELAPCRVGHWESSFDEGQRWAEPSLEHAAWQMRRVYERFAEARERALALRQRVRARFSPDAVLPTLRAALRASADRRPGTPVGPTRPPA